jgi:large subunit ribosomal protein L9
MKLILTAGVDNLGKAGDVVEVKDGYGRNYLIPRQYAIAWTRGAEKQIAGIKRSREVREIRGLDHAQEVGAEIEGLQITLSVRAGAAGRLFGAVTQSDIAAAIKQSGGPSVDRRAVQISQPIKSLGTHIVGVKLHDAVTAHVRLDVVAA